MEKCQVVIGSLWGDEGKGHITSDLCTNQTLNVRFNGGSQAAHTVLFDDQRRHAFSHFGSGTFKGATTYLTEDFIVNPIAFCMEHVKLHENFGILPRVIVNPDSIVTTPWDIYINQAVETCRGEKRHGSCGYGINETVVRSAYPEFKITTSDLLDMSATKEKFRKIREEYVPKRLKEEYNLSIEELPSEYKLAFNDETNWKIFEFFAREFLVNVKIQNDIIFKLYNHVVFEGAQGLLLDQNNEEFFPYVTTSNTGLQNVVKTLKKLGYKGPLDIYYVSRPYFTRHGAGPLNGEILAKPYEKIEDKTNIPNEFQGTLRFAFIDFSIIASAIKQDIRHLATCKAIPTVNVAFTCMDQLDKVFCYINGTKQFAATRAFEEIAQTLMRKTLPELNNVLLYSYDKIET